MGGVDLCDMLISLYHNILTQNVGISKLSFSALIFRRSMAGIYTDVIVSNSESWKCNWLCSLELLKGLQKLGIPSELLGDHQNVTQMNQLPYKSDIRYNGIHRWPEFCKKKLNCHLCKTGNSRVYCKKCNICSCLRNNRKVFYDFNIN